MMTRKSFLKSAVATVAGITTAPLASMVGGCAPAAFSVRAPVVDNRVIIPLDGLPDLKQPYAYAKVYTERHANPFVIFRLDDGQIRAVLTTCSHSGCEVRKLPTKFECPCHGSEYSLMGSVLKGPAPAPLESFVVEQYADRLEFLLEGPE